jgi:hypothetical protein
VELSDFIVSHEDPMTDDGMALLEALQRAYDGNLLRSLGLRSCSRSSWRPKWKG